MATRKKQLPENRETEAPITPEIFSLDERENEAPVSVPQTWWFPELVQQHDAGLSHAFALTGNIRDYINAIPGLSLKKHLFLSHKQNDLVVFWHQAQGLEFASPEMLERFLKILGVDEEAYRKEFDTTKPLVAFGLLTPLLQLGKKAGEREQIKQIRLQVSQQVYDAKVAENVRIYEEKMSALGEMINQGRYGSSFEANRKGDAIRAEKFQADDAAEAEMIQANAIANNYEPFRIVIILDYMDTVIPHGDQAPADERKALIHILEMARDKSIGERGHWLYLLAPSIESLHSDIARTDSGWMPITIPYPNEDERERFLTRILHDNPNLTLSPGVSLLDIVRLTAGLTYLNLEDIALQAEFLHVPISLDLVKWRKKMIIQAEFDGLLELIEGDQGFEAIAGLEDVKELLRRNVMIPMRAGKEKRRLVPRGMLFMGPSGTGKTFLARCLAKECEMIFIKLDPSKLYGKYVGETEEKLRRVIALIQSIGKCFVFIDEIDQALAGRGENNGGDSGVSNRFFSNFMQFMSGPENQGRIVIIGATNRPGLLDPALKRPGRFDYKIIIPAPSLQECAAILKVQMESIFRDTDRDDYPTDAQYTSIGNQMEGYTGAEIEGVVQKARTLAEYDNDASLIDILLRAFAAILPTTQNIREMTNEALAECNDIETIPERFHEQVRATRRNKLRGSTGTEPVRTAIQLPEDEEEIRGRRAHSPRSS